MKNQDSKLCRRRTARHEAGHAVISVIMHEKIVSVQIYSFYSKKKVLGQVRFFNREPMLNCYSNTQYKKFLELKIIRNLAGVIAQYMNLAKRYDLFYIDDLIEGDFFDLSGPNGDYKKVLEDMKQLIDSKTLNDIGNQFRDQYISFLINKCFFIVQQPPITNAIETITALLMEKSKITGEETYTACFDTEGFEEICATLRSEYLGIEKCVFAPAKPETNLV